MKERKLLINYILKKKHKKLDFLPAGYLHCRMESCKNINLFTFHKIIMNFSPEDVKFYRVIKYSRSCGELDESH